jgi:hypothetical protein
VFTAEHVPCSLSDVTPGTQVVPVICITINRIYDVVFLQLEIKEFTLCGSSPAKIPPDPPIHTEPNELQNTLIPKESDIVSPREPDTSPTLDPTFVEVSEYEVNSRITSDANITLVAPSKVYLESYLERVRVAKQYKTLAINAMIEAKKIKKTYMLPDIQDSDSEFDADMNDLSDSEYSGHE